MEKRSVSLSFNLSYNRCAAAVVRVSDRDFSKTRECFALNVERLRICRQVVAQCARQHVMISFSNALSADAKRLQMHRNDLDTSLKRLE